MGGDGAVDGGFCCLRCNGVSVACFSGPILLLWLSLACIESICALVLLPSGAAVWHRFASKLLFNFRVRLNLDFAKGVPSLSSSSRVL